MWIDNFKSPGMSYRPKVRYWMPHAVVSEKGIVADIADIADRGFGGVEVVTMRDGVRYDFYRRENMWGSDAWISAMRILLREAKSHGLSVDFANGPSWPIADVEAVSPDSDSIIRELAYGKLIIEAGKTYKGEIPKPQADSATPYQRLISLALYRISGEAEIDIQSYIPLPLEESVCVTAPDDGDYVLFAYFDKPSVLRKNSGIFYVVDHFSRAGTDAIMDVWENKILPELEEYRDVIGALFCDSLEYIVQLEWTRDFVERFKREKGYDIIPYLPCLGNLETVGSPDRNLGVFPPTRISGYTLSDKDTFIRVNHDFFDIINHGYCHEHLEYMQQRAEKLGLTVRYQVAYNKNLEAESSALYVGIPENEPLGRPLLDNFRIMSAAVNIDRKPVYSYECAAESWNAYGQTHEDVLWWAKRSYAGGMNAQVFHGANYCGYYDGDGNINGLGPGLTWPGFEGFTHPRWANAWNRTFSCDTQREMLDYLARCNFLLRNPHKCDVAIYRHEYKNNCFRGAFDGGYIYADANSLNDAGYTYEFLSPSLMKHPNARVENGVFDPEGAAYRAIIVNNEEYLDYFGAKKLLEYNKEGLNVIFVGRIPSKCFYMSEIASNDDLVSVISQIDYVFVESLDGVAGALEQNGIIPDVKPQKRCEIRPVHITVDGTDFYYLYNSHTVSYGKATGTTYPYIDKNKWMKEIHCNFSLFGDGDVYEIDGFSGRIKRLDSVSQNGRTSLYLDFKRDEAKIIAVLNDTQAQMLGICAENDEKYIKSGEIFLNDWTLSLESIHAPDQKISTFYESIWRTEPELHLDILLPWCEISPEWERICGIGTYKTEFTIDKIPYKAMFKAENISDTYRVFVNGKKFASVDPALGETEISCALSKGKNTIMVVVYGTLRNAVAYDYTKQNVETAELQKNGMWGRVSISLYKKD